MRPYSRGNPNHTSIKMPNVLSKEEPLKFAEAKGDNPIWGHFLKCTTEEKAKCNNCGKILSCKGSSTGALRGHLKTVHKIDVELKIKPTPDGATKEERFCISVLINIS